MTLSESILRAIVTEVERGEPFFLVERLIPKVFRTISIGQFCQLFGLRARTVKYDYVYFVRFDVNPTEPTHPHAPNARF